MSTTDTTPTVLPKTKADFAKHLDAHLQHSGVSRVYGGAATINRMMRTHRQVKCEGCGLWAIWVEKTTNVD
jgi:hypothetical protein